MDVERATGGADLTVGAPGGLSSEEAAARLEVHGPNLVPAAPRVRLTHRVLTQLRDPLLLVLLGGAVLTVVVGDLTDTVVILAVLVANSTVGVIQEVRAEAAIRALAGLNAPQARVVRDGSQRSLPAAEVVPGDLLLLAEGDLVAADGLLVEAAALLVDESSLTGESVPADKAPDAAEPDGRRVSAGTSVVRGRGRVVVSATGARSATGRLATLLSAPPPITPLQRRLAGLSRVLAVVAVALAALVGAQGLVWGQPWELVAVTAISLVVAAVPESLPTVIVLSLALGAHRMATHRAVVRRLPAVETLGSVSVIATDKTGTLTEGRMTVRRLWTPTGEATGVGSGFDPAGTVRRDNRAVSAAEAPDLAELLRAATLCTDARLLPPTADRPEWGTLGDPTEAALLAAAARLGLDEEAERSAAPRLAEFPFDSRRKRMTTVHRSGPGLAVVTKGAPELLLHDGVLAISAEEAARVAATASAYAAAGLRVLGVAVRRTSVVPGSVADAEHDLRLLGLVGIADPAKASARDTLAAVRSAGIELVLITGDHLGTARAVAHEVGLADQDAAVVDGRTLGDEADDLLARATIVARATPDHKVAVLDARQRRGQVVAMIGDGVNDGPALRRADIGVAMGRRGTEVARQAADLVLADDELRTLVTAVGEGRRIYANVRRFLMFGMSGGAAEVLVMLAGPWLGMPLPLLPAQILWINLLTHGLTGVSLGAEPAEPDALRKPPRPPDQSVLGDGLWARILRIAVLLTVVSLAAGLWAAGRQQPWPTMVFLTLGLAQLGVALAIRARPTTLDNPFLLVALGVAAALQVAAVYLGPLGTLLGTRPLGLTDLLVAVGLSVTGFLGVHLDRAVHRR